MLAMMGTGIFFARPNGSDAISAADLEQDIPANVTSSDGDDQNAEPDSNITLETDLTTARSDTPTSNSDSSSVAVEEIAISENVNDEGEREDEEVDYNEGL